jgi:hypothetical protein
VSPSSKPTPQKKNRLINVSLSSDAMAVACAARKNRRQRRKSCYWDE